MYWWQWIFKASYQKWIKLLFVLFCEFQEWTVLLFVIIVPFSFSHSLHSAHIPQYWHSMESSSKHFFFYICTFCISFLSIGFECILTILWDSVRILSLRCVDWSQYVCRQERKRLYQVSIRSFWFNSHVMYFCYQWLINFHSLHWIATVSFHNQTLTHQYSRHFTLTIKTSLSPKINFYAK